MKSILFYLLQVIISSGVLYGYYHMFLREKKFHQYNRFYLLSATAVSILVPFVNIPVYYNQATDYSSIIYQTLSVISTHDTESFSLNLKSISPHPGFFTWQNLIPTFYTVIACFILTKFFIALYKIKVLLKTYPVKKLENIHFIDTTEPGTPFSFFKWLFWNNKISLNSAEGEQIFRHELFHIQQKHSWDIVFMELLTIIFWINPFFHIMKKEVKAIHEFLADEFAMKDSQNWNYPELLLMQALGTQNNHLSNPFFHNQIKRRISMITSSKHSSYQYLRKVMVLPVAAILIILFAFKFQNKENKPGIIRTQTPITVVIDPGHGGTDAGVTLNGIKEKDICLAIAKKLKALNKDENIHLLFTRLGDSATSPKEDADFADRNNADLLISLHVNAADQPWTDASKNGIEVYVSSRKKEDYKSSVLATALINELQNTHDINRYVLKKETGIWILDAPRCPTALIEFGYITNPGDFSFISNEANQEKVALNILTAIQKYVSTRSQSVSEENAELDLAFQKNTGGNMVTFDRINIRYIDTIPLQGKIKKEDINEIRVRNGLIVIKLNNGDSILAVQNDYREREREDQMALEQLLQSKQSSMKEHEMMQMLQERQRETDLQNADFERMMSQRKEENAMRHAELEKLLSMKRDNMPKDKQEELGRMLEMKKRELEQHEIEFKHLIEDRQRQVQMQNEEFRRILEAQQRQLELQQENRKNMELKENNSKDRKKEPSNKNKNKD